MKKVFSSNKLMISFGLFLMVVILNISCNHLTSTTRPIRDVVELNTGESKDIELHNGKIVNLSLIEIAEIRDSIRNAIREVKITISIDGEKYTLGVGNYNLPVTIGEIQIDCPVTSGYYSNTSRDSWTLKKDARFRIWPKDSPYIQPETFVYPLQQRWFANMTQSGNEPSWLGWGEVPENKSVYYHNGHDMGGVEGLDEAISATDGLVVSARNQTLEGYQDLPGDVRKDVVYIKDNRDWYYRYSHLDSIFPKIHPGAVIKMKDKIGLMGKQGGSGGWVHLHFGISYKSKGADDWITEDAYVYAWESYVQLYKPALIAVARPHQLLRSGQEVTLDGSKSKGLSGDIVSFEWNFSDGTQAMGAVQKRKFNKPGLYSEILKITDTIGNIDYDFSVVQVIDRESPNEPVPTLQAAYYPTLQIKPGDSVAFFVRTFNTDNNHVVWDFGDGTSTVGIETEKVTREEQTKGKFAKISHIFTQTGHYIVKAENINSLGIKSTAHLHVVITGKN